MRDVELGRVVRALRRRRGLRQEDCARLAGVHRSTWSIVERGHLDRTSLAVVRRCLEVLEVRLELLPQWRGASLDRLLDEGHAAMQAVWKERLERWSWQVRAEVSFNHYGERGRIDLLAWHSIERLLLVVEVKTEIADAQRLLGGLDAKVRIAPTLLRGPRPRAVVPLLLLGEGMTNRDRVRRIAPLLSSFTLHGRSAVSWLRQPVGVESGLLVYTNLRFATGRSVPGVGPHRVRPVRGVANVETAPRSAAVAAGSRNATGSRRP